jgi:hypothetical protein
VGQIVAAVTSGLILTAPQETEKKNYARSRILQRMLGTESVTACLYTTTYVYKYYNTIYNYNRVQAAEMVFYFSGKLVLQNR